MFPVSVNSFNKQTVTLMAAKKKKTKAKGKKKR
jgi:hypothetical protein